MKVSLEFIDNSEVKDNIREDIFEMEKMITEILETHRIDSQYNQLKFTNRSNVEFLQKINNLSKK